MKANTRQKYINRKKRVFLGGTQSVVTVLIRQLQFHCIIIIIFLIFIIHIRSDGSQLPRDGNSSALNTKAAEYKARYGACPAPCAHPPSGTLAKPLSAAPPPLAPGFAARVTQAKSLRPEINRARDTQTRLLSRTVYFLPSSHDSATQTEARRLQIPL